MRAILGFCITALICFGGAPIRAMAQDAKVMFIAGKDSHGWGSHEHHAGSKVLSEALAKSGLGIRTELVLDTWPEDASAFDGVKAIVIYCDGQAKHVLNGHEEDMEKLSAKGVGLVCLHYAVEVSPGPQQPKFFDWLGGYFETNWSVNPHWTPQPMIVAEHPITRGVKPFELKDEWYYHMRFRPGMQGVAPILSGRPSMDTLAEKDGPRNGNPALREEIRQGKIQHIAWAAENKHGGRGFGFTGGHTHSNWAHDDFRKLVLNAIVWTAGLEVPKTGVQSETPIILRNEKLMTAIAKGDAADVERHILLGQDVNGVVASGWTPLHAAAARNQQEVAKVLFKQGADVNALSQKKNAAIHLCVGRNALGMARLLIAHGADLGLRDSGGWTPLHTAAAKDALEMARLLLDKGANANALSEKGGTPLHEAAASGGRALVELLVKHGASPEVVSSTGKTALDIALKYKNTEAEAALRKL